MHVFFYSLIGLVLFPFLSNAQKIAAYDLEPGTANTYPHHPTGYKDMIVTYATYPIVGLQLTTIDITTSTKTVHKFTNKPIHATGTPFAVVGGSLYFVGCPNAQAQPSCIGVDIWKFDDGGNHQNVTNFGGCCNSYISHLTVLNNKIYFFANVCNSTPASDGRLYEYDPATNLTKHCTFPTSVFIQEENYLTAFNNKLYFAGRDATVGAEPWCYDPNSGNLSLLADIHQGNKHSWPSEFIVITGNLYFTATTFGVITDPTNFGDELYVYDGTNPVKRVTDLNPGSGSGVYSIGSFNNEIYLGGTNGVDWGLYKYNPANQTVQPIYTSFNGTSQPSALSYPYYMTEHMGELFFRVGNTAHGHELWKFDGVNNPVMIADMMPGPTDGQIRFPLSYKNKFFFCAKDNIHGAELFHFATGGTDETSVLNLFTDEPIEIYPNPATSVAYFKISGTTPVYISISDIAGHHVYNKKHTLSSSNIIAIPTGSFSPGIYTYSIRNNEGTFLTSGKLLKE